MNCVKGNNLFKNVSSSIDEKEKNNTSPFRKNLSERLSLSSKEKSLERIPGHDVLFFN